METPDEYYFNALDLNSLTDSGKSLDALESPELIDFFVKVVQKHAQYASTIPPFNPITLSNFKDVAMACTEFQSVKSEGTIKSPYVRNFSGAYKFYYPHQWASAFIKQAHDMPNKSLALDHLPSLFADICSASRSYLQTAYCTPKDDGVPAILYRPISDLPDLDNMMMHVPLTDQINVDFSDFINIDETV